MALMVSATLFAERVSQDDAALVANNFMNVRSSSNVKKALPAKKMVRKATATEDLYYLYENANGEGWVIVAADDAVTPILAYSETGHFRTDNMPVNIQKWLGEYSSIITKIKAEGSEATEEVAGEWETLRKNVRKAKGDAVVGPLIQTTWDQGEPFWNKCPGSGNNKAYTGCVATAMAQVMKYWNWPVQGTGSKSYRPLDPNSDDYVYGPYSTQSADFGATTYDWDNMLNAYTYLDDEGYDHVLSGLTTAQKDAVATLMYHCGVASEMMYGDADAGGSGTMTINYGDWNWGITTTNKGGCAQNALYTFFGYKQPTGYYRNGDSDYGYASWTDADWTAMLKAELDLSRPIMYAGGTAQSGGGHSFVCDGYDDAGYFHFNWGWSSSCDGYYKTTSLKPGTGGAGSGSSGNFTPEQDVIIGIEPDREPIEPGEPVYITWSVDGVAGEPVEVEKGKLITLPADPTCACGKVFVGWTALTSINPNTEPSDLFTTNADKRATADITYYAVFADVEAGGSGTPTEVATVTFKTRDGNDSNQDNAQNIATKLVQSSTGIDSFSGSKLYEGKSGVKLGTSSASGSITLTLTSTAAVSKVVVNASQYVGQSGTTDSGKLKVTVGSKELGQQTPAANLVFEADPAVESNTITIATTSKRAYVASISVIAGQGGASYSNYSKSCDCGTESVVNTVIAAPKAVKIIENGQIVIIRDNAKYTIVGQKIQ